LAADWRTITTYVWRIGTVTVKHFFRSRVFFGGLFCTRRLQLWGAIIRLAFQFATRAKSCGSSLDDIIKKTAGTSIEGLADYRNGSRLS
jgi:hypothetical protein